MCWSGLVEKDILKQNYFSQNSSKAQDAENFINMLIQEREFQVLTSNGFNMNSFNGLDNLAMILTSSNEDFDFRPLICKTKKLLFENEVVK